ncbi:glycosyl transferase family 90 [Vibrio sp. RC27]
MRKFNYYLSHGLLTLIPTALHRYIAKKKVKSITEEPSTYLQSRLDYYNQISDTFILNDKPSTQIDAFKKTGGTTYYFDLFKVIKGFPKANRFHYINGDVREVPSAPAFVKSRPINNNNHNSIILKLNAIRHFQFLEDPLTFAEKKDLAVWRGLGFLAHRKVVIEKYYDHPRCNIGRHRPQEGQPWDKPRMTIEEQLKYKFILCIEGRDVATNLKWVMSSNSLAVMSEPKFETWFMEGRLEGGVHYVEVKDDYSDLIEKMDYYIAHPEEAETIIANAHAWIEQFKNPEQERLISLLVANKYFKHSGQEHYSNNT